MNHKPNRTLTSPRPFFAGLLLGGLLLGGMLLSGGCAKDHEMGKVSNPTDPSITGLTPPVPTGVTVAVGNRQVQVSWFLTGPDSTLASSIRLYRLYRRAGDEPNAILADSSLRPPAAVRDLVNGQLYRFSVAAVLDNGLEGRRSTEVAAAPGVYGVQIESGRDPIRTNSVQVTLLAPDGTAGVELSNDAEFLSSTAKPFSPLETWQLLPGEGEREVFARFFDVAGNPSQTVSDRVTVDLRAEIRDVTFSPTETEPGQHVLFILDGGEPFGRAQVQLGSGGRRLDLRDDGMGGDAVADDGHYSLDYLAEDDLDVVEAVVTGSFADQAGNTASNRVSAERLTVHRNPPAVTLGEIAVLGPKELYLTWSQTNDAGRFSSYRIFRADAPGVDTSSTRKQIREVTSRTSTTYTDSGLEPGHVYYYRVYVVDGAGFMTSSNERSATPKRNPPPDPVELYPPSNVTETSVSLSFSRSLSPDFMQYRIYRGEQEDLANDPTRRLLTTVSSAGNTTYQDNTEVEEGKVYYYQVEVVDNAGSSALSNVVSATIPDKPPTAVTLNNASSVGETSLLLSWTKNEDLDFARYEVRRAQPSGVGPNSTLVGTLDAVEQLNLLDQGLRENTAYAYRVFVVDNGGHSVGSNEISVTTKNADPDPVNLSALSEDTGANRPTVRVTWSISTAHDFKEYRLYRDTSPAVGEESSTLVRTVADSVVVSYTDSDDRLEDNTRYYYRVFVHDTAGGKEGSNEQSILLHNRAPLPVTLEEPTTTSSTIRLRWSQNNDSDFARYQVLQWTTNPDAAIVAATFTHKEQTSHTVSVAEHDPTRYFFRIRVWDDGKEGQPDLSSDSNTVSAKVIQ